MAGPGGRVKRALRTIAQAFARRLIA